MDTSEQNIKMCEKAVKIQALWKPVVGDYVSLARFPGQGFLLEIKAEGKARPLYQIEHGFNNQYRSELIFLPRLDQLWKLIPKKVRYIDFERDIKFKEGIGLRLYAKIPISPGITDHWNIGGFSVEQLLLKLFYKAKYNLTWNGKDWV